MKRTAYLIFAVLLFNVSLSAQKEELPTVMAGTKILDSFNLALDSQATIVFTGDSLAALFTRELSESYKGVLAYNYISTSNSTSPSGFVHASPPGQGWSGTWWTRDGGTFMREQILGGSYEHASASADALMKLVDKNSDGFYAYPEYFRDRSVASGSEIDGTATIIMSLTSLWHRLPESPFRQKIYDFLHQSTSPIRGLCYQVEKNKLIIGTGEFGQGCCGPYKPVCNVVQNNQSWMAIEAVAKMEYLHGDTATARTYREYAQRLRDAIVKYFTNPADSSWYWTLDPKSLVPANFNNIVGSENFSGINGCLSHFSDAMGLEPKQFHWKGIDIGLNTFKKLLKYPPRAEAWNTYGLFILGRLNQCSPSYDQGYALQTMLIFDMDTLADKAARSLAFYTYNRGQRYSPYHFIESWSIPPLQNDGTRGCGALNLINVSESMKDARLMVGIDDRQPDTTIIIPRCPISWSGYNAQNWPIMTPSGIVRVDIHFMQTGSDRSELTITVRNSKTIPVVRVRLKHNGQYIWQIKSNVTNEKFS
jgi:hypothetical protein